MKYLHYKGFQGSIEYSSDDDCLHGVVLGIERAFVSYEGTTLHELIEDFHQAIDGYLHLQG